MKGLIHLNRELFVERATQDYYNIGEAYGYLQKSAADTPQTVTALHGRLTASKSGWLLLDVPNALVRGVFDTLKEPGIELPDMEHGFNAHVSVMHKSEVEKLGGPGKITERGKWFSYQLGPLQTVRPAGWNNVSRVWFIKVFSPELKQLRKSYGLSSLPNDGKHEFHITVALRKTKVLGNNDISK